MRLLPRQAIFHLPILGVLFLLCSPGIAHAVKAAPSIGQSTSLETAYGTVFDAIENGPGEARVGVLVVPGRWGLNRQIQHWVADIAAMGFHSLAMDLFDGRPVRDEAMAQEVWQAIDPLWIDADLQAALARLRQGRQRVVIMAWDDSVPHVMRLLVQHGDIIAALVVLDHAGIDADALSVPMLEISGKGVRAGRFSEAARQAVQNFMNTNL